MLFPRRAFALTAVGVAFALGAPAGALAARVIAPPGNSGVSQYFEVVPTAGGSAPVNSSAAHGPVLSASTRSRLQSAGAAGAAVAAFAERTGTPHANAPSARHLSSHAHAHAHAAPAYVAPLVRSAAVTGGGTGWGLYAALGAVALGALGAALLLRRRSA